MTSGPVRAGSCKPRKNQYLSLSSGTGKGTSQLKAGRQETFPLTYERVLLFIKQTGWALPPKEGQPLLLHLWT